MLITFKVSEVRPQLQDSCAVLYRFARNFAYEVANICTDRRRAEYYALASLELEGIESTAYPVFCKAREMVCAGRRVWKGIRLVAELGTLCRDDRGGV